MKKIAKSSTEHDDLDDLTIYEEYEVLDESSHYELEISLGRSNDDGLMIYEEPLISHLELYLDDELEIYQNNDWRHKIDSNPGFFLDLPPGDMTKRGGFSRGTVTLKNIYFCLSLSWIRNPGIEPRILLADLIGKTYGPNNSSQEFSSIMAGYHPAVITNVQFRENCSPKGVEFAAWTSGRSDRLFLASVKYLQESSQKISRDFHSIINGFIDTEITSYLTPRSSIMDSWAVVLRDLLCSYAYTGLENPVCTGVQIKIKTSSRKRTGDIDENCVELSSFISRELLKRTALVWRILIERGYHVKLMQRGGNIWPLVCDLSGNWQAVSLNPSEPGRMIGALVNSQDNSHKWHSGVCYDDYASLGRENDTVKSPIESESEMKKLCEPSQDLRLSPPENRDAKWIRDLYKLLHRYSYRNRFYQRGIFSCANTSQILWAFLIHKCYDSRLICSFDEHPMPRHMWVMAKPVKEDDFVSIEATVTNLRGEILSLGALTFEEKYYNGIMYNSSRQYSILYPEQGMNLEPKDGLTHIWKKTVS